MNPIEHIKEILFSHYKIIYTKKRGSKTLNLALFQTHFCLISHIIPLTDSVYFDTESVMKAIQTVTERAAFYIGMWQGYCFWFFKTKDLCRKEKYAKR